MASYRVNWTPLNVPCGTAITVLGSMWPAALDGDATAVAITATAAWRMVLMIGICFFKMFYSIARDAGPIPANILKNLYRAPESRRQNRVRVHVQWRLAVDAALKKRTRFSKSGYSRRGHAPWAVSTGGRDGWGSESGPRGAAYFFSAAYSFQNSAAVMDGPGTLRL